MSGNGEPAFVAVDWGTSSLRAWLVTAAGTVIAEARSAEGMDQLSPDRFEAVLRARLADLGPATQQLAAPWPVVLCGMVGARQGWREAGYIDLPVALGALAEKAVRVTAEGLDARILPGIARRSETRPDVMRGEETQLLGLTLDDPGFTGEVCMPGTHCKWVRIEAGRATDFVTVMTGELFAVLSGQSILRHGIGGARPSGDPQAPAFRAGLADGLGDPAGLTAHLFGLRAGGLLLGRDGVETADRLSGLLIGAEIGGRLARGPLAGPLVLVGGGRLGRLYGAALAQAGLAFRGIDADSAVRAGLLAAARHLWPLNAERSVA